MARKKTAARLNRLTAAAAAADSTDTEEDVSTDNDELQQKQPPQNTPTENKQVSDDSDSDSDETQNSPTASAFTVRPISSKPMTDTPISPTSKKPAAAQSKSKRPVVIDNNKDKDSGIKKRKVVAAEEDAQIEEKKSGGAANRLWSEDDEIAILEGMIEYRGSHGGGDPNADMAAFHEFVKGAINVEVSKNQLYDKIRRLKKKYKVNVEKGGNDPVFRKKGQEKKLFELSKKIWAGGGGNVNGVGEGSKGTSAKKKDKVKDVGVVVENGSAVKLIKDKLKDEKEEVGGESDKDDESEKEEEDEVEEEDKVVDGVKEVVMEDGVDGYVEEEEGGDDFLAMFPRLKESFEAEQSYLSMPKGAESLVKEKMRLIGRDNAKMLEAKWNDIRVMEFELYIKKIKLFQEQSQMLMRKM